MYIIFYCRYCLGSNFIAAQAKHESLLYFKPQHSSTAGHACVHPMRCLDLSEKDFNEYLTRRGLMDHGSSILMLRYDDYIISRIFLAFTLFPSGCQSVSPVQMNFSQLIS